MIINAILRGYTRGSTRGSTANCHTAIDCPYPFWGHNVQGCIKHFTSLDREENGPHFLGNKIKHIMNYTPTLITASWYNSRFQCPLSFKFSGYRCLSRPPPRPKKKSWMGTIVMVYTIQTLWMNNRLKIWQKMTFKQKISACATSCIWTDIEKNRPKLINSN